MNLSNGWPMMGSTGEIILFACTAIVMVACALGVLFFKKAAHSVICVVGVMLGLAVLYIANSAPFLGVAQIVVYTGAIMMLFLFVIMLIGIGTSDDYARQRFPSSKTCSKCGNVKEKLELSERSYKCECYGIEIDRDYNAALNIKNIGKLMLKY